MMGTISEIPIKYLTVDAAIFDPRDAWLEFWMKVFCFAFS